MGSPDAAALWVYRREFQPSSSSARWLWAGDGKNFWGKNIRWNLQNARPVVTKI